MNHFAEAVTWSIHEPLPYLLVLFPFFFVGLFYCVCIFLSRMGGWHGLGKKFRSENIPAGKTLHSQSAQLGGWCNYNRVLTMVISKEGLHLRILSPFRPGHPALLIPWEEIKNQQSRRILWIERISFEIGDPAITRMTVSKKVFEQFPDLTGTKEVSPR